jgi:dissimilatory sulfite reductase (desulfoviridin) alpha/beta subunit
MKTQVDYAALKKSCLLPQTRKNRFSMRLRVAGGQVGAEQLREICAIAERHGKGIVHITSRQGLEIPFIKLSAIGKVKAELADAGLQLGVCGPRVRAVTACQGSAICPSGLIETSALAKKFDERYVGRDLPCKLKIAITGCPNNCLKTDINDIGIKGALVPEWTRSKCSYCGACASACPASAIAADRKKRTLAYDEKRCIQCGKCVRRCPDAAWTGRNGYRLSFGGMCGKTLKAGARLLPVLFETKQVFQAVDAALAFFAEKGKAGERFGKLLSRTGTAALKRKLTSSISN